MDQNIDTLGVFLPLVLSVYEAASPNLIFIDDSLDRIKTNPIQATLGGGLKCDSNQIATDQSSVQSLWPLISDFKGSFVTLARRLQIQSDTRCIRAS